MNKEKKNLFFPDGLLPLVFGILALISFFKEGVSWRTNLFLTMCLVMFYCLLFNQVMLNRIKGGIVRIVRPLGIALSATLMAMVFYFVFTPTAVILRIFKRDILGKNNGDKQSYWNLREKKLLHREDYFRQF